MPLSPLYFAERATNKINEYESELITVCDHCLQASCWQGVFYCDDYKTAGTTEKTRKELAKLDRESSDYWDNSMKESDNAK